MLCVTEALRGRSFMGGMDVHEDIIEAIAEYAPKGTQQPTKQLPCLETRCLSVPRLPVVDSDLLTPPLHDQLATWVKSENWTLLYRASRDGYDAETFHRCCDGKGPTVTLVRTAYGTIAGKLGCDAYERGDGWCVWC